MGKMRGVYGVLVEKLEGNSPLGRPRNRWEGYIKMNLQEVGCGGIDWIELSQERERERDRRRAHMNGGINLRVP
jgi:hypothetical protein